MIERRFRGERFHVSTGCRTERAAVKELERFEQDPYRYVPGGEGGGRVRVTASQVEAYRDWMIGHRKTTREWANDVARYLADWIEDLAGADLRHVRLLTLEELSEKRGTGIRHRCEAIKGYCHWLRRKGLLNRVNDPAIELAIPKAQPAKHSRQRSVEPERISKVLPHLPAVTIDVLQLQAGTGWHISEVRRFAQGGQLLSDPSGKHLAVLVVRHKSGVDHATSIQHEDHFEAAKRLRALGSIPSRPTLCKHMRDACDAAGVARFGLGVIRHSVATNAAKHGEQRGKISRFLGHTSEQTTDIYLGSPAPAEAITVLRLVKPG